MLTRTSSLKRTGGLKRSPLAKVSKKRKREGKLYGHARAQYLAHRLNCQAGIKGVCTGISTDVHHMEKRGKNYLEMSTWMAVCRCCHKWIHAHGDKAREMGLLK